MTRIRLTAAVVVAMTLAACGSGPGRTIPPTATSGIDLVTMAGPTCPVQQQGQVCEKAISARVLVQTTAGATLTTVQTGADGTARVPLPPGTYTVAAQDGGGGDASLPRPPLAETVTVKAGAFTKVQLTYDTGIR